SGIRKRQRLHDDRVDDAEHHGVHGNAETEDDDDQEREAGTPPDDAARIANVLHEAGHSWRERPCIAHVVLDLGDTAKATSRIGVGIRCPGGAALLLAHRKVKRDLVLEVLFALFSRKQCANAETQTTQPLHRSLQWSVSPTPWRRRTGHYVLRGLE